MKRFSVEYLTYIDSAHWRYVKRPQVLAHYGYRCMNRDCPHKDAGSPKNPFQADHQTYPSKLLKGAAAIRAFQNQPVQDFRVYCKKCHALKTKLSRK